MALCRWYEPANALINNFYYKTLGAVSGCTAVSACNYNAKATKDDGSCVAAKVGFNCNGKALVPGSDGAVYFIRSDSAVPLSLKTHARVDLPNNFEMGFEITPQATPVKQWSSIIHVTGTGKVLCCGVLLVWLFNVFCFYSFVFRYCACRGLLIC